MTAALEGGEWSAARPDRTFPLGKTRYPFYRRLGGPQGRLDGRTRSRTVGPVVSRYPLHALMYCTKLYYKRSNTFRCPCAIFRELI